MQLLLSILFSLLQFNCENLFDCQHDEGFDDYEYVDGGTRHWTPHRYWKKLNDVSRVVLASVETGGKLPDLVALCEVENDSVMTSLTHRAMLRNVGYDYLMTSSADKRGVDVALLFQPSSFQPIRHCSLRVPLLPGMRPTRDILYVAGRVLTGDTLHVFVVHAPSRLGGVAHSTPFRVQVAKRLLASVDSVRALSPQARIIVAGDFNDESSDRALQLLAENGLSDVPPTIDKASGAKGTYRYKGKWQSIDHVLVGRDLIGCVTGCSIPVVPYMIEPDPTYGGIRPKRTYYGGRYLGGCSDHLPLLLQMKF